MKDKFESLRRKYENFRRGKEDPLAVRSETLIPLEEAKRKRDQEIIDEIEDMLIDLRARRCQH